MSSRACPPLIRVVLTGLLAALPATTTVGQSDDIDNIRIGVEGHHTLGRLTALTARVTAADAGPVQLEVTAPDPDGNSVRFRSEPTALTAGQSRDLSVLIKIGQLGATLHVHLIREDEIVADETIRFRDADAQAPMMPDLQVIATIGNPSGFAELDTTEAEESDELEGPRVRVIPFSTEVIPTRGLDLNAIRVLVISDDYSLSEEQTQAVRDWVRFGGHLIVSVSSKLDDYLASPLGTFVQKWVPADRELSQLAELPDLETLGDNIARVPLARRRIPAARLIDGDPVRLVQAIDGTVVAQAAVGFGRVTVFGLDMSNGPLTRWTALPVVCRKLVFGDEGETRAVSTRARIGHTGITDLATQLHATQEHFPEVERPSSWMAMSLILLSVLILGPVDYLLVHRVLKRPRLTWITFPLLVGLGCIGSFALAQAANGKVSRLNQLDIVDIDAAGSGAFRAHSWFTIYSGQTQRSSAQVRRTESFLEATGAELQTRTPLAWAGIPENVFGGMLRQAGFGLARVPWAAAPGEIDGLPLRVWSTANLTSTAFGDVTPKVNSQLESSTLGLLSGTFSHDLPGPIRNWVLAYGRRVYRPRDGSGPRALEIRPGEQWVPNSPRVTQRDLESFLTGTRAFHVQRKPGEAGENLVQEQTPYDPLRRDPEYVVQMLTLHASAGADSYTGLTNTLLREYDLSRLSLLNRAVLLGRIDMPAAEFTLDEKPVEATRQVTFVRILLPVSRVPVARNE